MGTTETLAKFVVEAKYRDIPREAIELAKGYIFDCVGHTLGGAPEPVTRRLVKMLKASGGAEEAGVAGWRFKTTLPNACWINGTAAHALELEAAGRFGGSNYSPVIPAALALGESLKASGKAVLEAFILGVEIQGRIGMGTIGAPNRGWIGFVYGPFGAAAAAAKLWKFSVEQLEIAFGHAGPYCGGFRRSTGYMTHLLDSGTACKDGMTAALLAKYGVTSCPDVIEDWEGFCEVYAKGGSGEYDLETMTRNLGNPWYIVDPGTAVKSYGCCMQNDRAVEALFGLISQHDIHYEDVVSVDVETPPHTGKMLRFNDPIDGEQAKFSLKHSLAAALLARKPDMPWTAPFTDAMAVDPKYKEARKKISWTLRTDLPMTRVHVGEQKVTVRMKDGRVLTNAVDALRQKGARGAADLTMEERMTIFKSCAQGKLSDAKIKRLADLLLNLEKVKDVSEVTDLMTSAKA
ncbi:MAG: MmgE/PrpD family protein [Chloroflexi bacterium]|nr:MmgE/PrpD family protein [Chloroflexota bacterium]